MSTIVFATGTLERTAHHVPSEKTSIALCTIKVARTDRNGHDWFDCKAFGETADTILAASAGDTLDITGPLRSEIRGKDGERRSKMFVVAETVLVHPAETSTDAA